MSRPASGAVDHTAGIMRPTPQELEAARSRTLPDIIGQDLAILFCGINPGLYSAAVGHHFARPGNRFWPALHAAGVTPTLLSPRESHLLLAARCGLTDIVERATARADELAPAELVTGRIRLEAKAREYRPMYVAILGIGAYRTAFGRPKAGLGPQPETIGEARLWVLPNPSGLNASHQPKDLAAAFRALWRAAAAPAEGGAG